MTNDTKYAELLKVTLSEEASSEQKLTSLLELHDTLLNEAALLTLIELGSGDNTTDVKIAIAALLIDKAQSCTKESDAYFNYAAQLALYEAEPKLRMFGVRMICDLISIRPEAEVILAEFFRYEHDDAVLNLAIRVALDLPALNENVRHALRTFSTRVSGQQLGPFFLLVDRLPFEDQAACVAEVLTPFASTEVKIRCLEMIASLSRLEPILFERICKLLETEALPGIWAGYFTLLFRFKDLSAEQQIRAFETLDGRSESEELLKHFASFFDSNPGLISHLKKAFEKSDVAPILTFLSLTSGTGIPDFALQALANPHADVRYAGVLQGLKLLSSQPDMITSALIGRLVVERHRTIRFAIAEGLQGNSLLNKAVYLKQLAEHYLQETDLAVKRVLATILLVPSPDAGVEAVLIECWTKILAEPLFDQSVKSTSLRRLLETSASVTPALQQSFSNLLDETYDVDNFKTIYDQGKLLFPDLKVVMPALVRTFYRFAEFYPKDPLREIAQLVKKRHQELTEIHGEIGRIAEITGDAELLSLASAEDQKNILYGQIQAAIREEEVGKIRDLIRGGYEKKTLRKSEIIKLYNDALHHSCLQQILIPTLDVMRDVKLYSKELVEAAFNFLQKYPYKSDSSREILKYLSDVLESDPSYSNQFLEQITNEKYQNVVNGFSDFSKKYVLGQRFRDNDHWREDYAENHILNLLDDARIDIMPRLREQVKVLLLTDVPSHWNLGHVYLYKLSRMLSKNTAEDVAIVAALFRKAKALGDSYLLERAANVFYYQWSELIRKKLMDHYTHESAKIASEVMNHHILQWYSRKRFQEAYWLNTAIDGIDFDHLIQQWEGPHEALDAFLRAAEDVAGGRVPERPNDYPTGMAFPEAEWNDATINVARLIYTARIPQLSDTIMRIKPIWILLQQNSKAKIASYVWAKPVTEEHLASLERVMK